MNVYQLMNSNNNVFMIVSIVSIGKLQSNHGVPFRMLHGQTVYYEKDSTSHRYNETLFYIDSPEVLQIVETLRVNQLIEVFGAYTSKNGTKKVRCQGMRPEEDREAEAERYKGCRQILYIKGKVQTLVTVGGIIPLHIITDDHKLTAEVYTGDEAIRAALRRYEPLSNNVHLTGRLWNDPELLPPTSGRRENVCHYGLAVYRPQPFYSKTDQYKAGLSNADYVWVNTFGKQAESDMVHLRQNSLVSVSGVLNFRKPWMQYENEEYPEGDPMRYVCPYCGRPFEYQNVTSELLVTNPVLYCSDVIRLEDSDAENVYRYLPV